MLKQAWRMRVSAAMKSAGGSSPHPGGSDVRFGVSCSTARTVSRSHRLTSSTPASRPSQPSRCTRRLSPINAPARDELAFCHTLDRLDPLQPSAADQQRHLAALATWQGWADGDNVPTNALHTTASLLTHRRGAEQQLARVLHDDIGRSTTRTPVGIGAQHDHYPTRTADRDIGLGR